MANYQAQGTGPISFVDANQKQQEIPLTAITFGPNGVDASAWPLYSANQTVVDGLLKQLVKQGLLKQGTQNAPIPSLTITATQPGKTGNAITVKFANPSQDAGTVEVTVSATEVYPGLTLATIGDALGTSADQANGLVFLKSNNNQAPKKFTGNVSGGTKFECKVDAANDDSAGAFTLKAAAKPITDADAQAINIAVTPDAAPAVTFTLTASWKKTATVTATTLTTSANPFAILVTFSAPAGAPLPAAGPVTLVGGAAATSSPAVAAKVTVFSS